MGVILATCWGVGVSIGGFLLEFENYTDAGCWIIDLCENVGGFDDVFFLKSCGRSMPRMTSFETHFFCYFRGSQTGIGLRIGCVLESDRNL